MKVAKRKAAMRAVSPLARAIDERKSRVEKDENLPRIN